MHRPYHHATPRMQVGESRSWLRQTILYSNAQLLPPAPRACERHTQERMEREEQRRRAKLERFNFQDEVS